MHTEAHVLNHESIVKSVAEFLINKPDGNRHRERMRKADLHAHGADLVLVGGKRNSEYFIIECKGKSNASSANSINKETVITEFIKSRTAAGTTKDEEQQKGEVTNLGLEG